MQVGICISSNHYIIGQLAKVCKGGSKGFTHTSPPHISILAPISIFTQPLQSSSIIKQHQFQGLSSITGQEHQGTWYTHDHPSSNIQIAQQKRHNSSVSYKFKLVIFSASSNSSIPRHNSWYSAA